MANKNLIWKYPDGRYAAIPASSYQHVGPGTLEIRGTGPSYDVTEEIERIVKAERSEAAREAMENAAKLSAQIADDYIGRNESAVVASRYVASAIRTESLRLYGAKEKQS